MPEDAILEMTPFGTSNSNKSSVPEGAMSNLGHVWRNDARFDINYYEFKFIGQGSSHQTPLKYTIRE